jgi:hypothetical protein
MKTTGDRALLREGAREFLDRAGDLLRRETVRRRCGDCGAFFV